MIYAIVMVCVVGAFECTLERAIWAEQSEPGFDSVFQCQEESIRYAFDHLYEMPLKKGERYRVAVDCEQAEEPI